VLEDNDCAVKELGENVGQKEEGCKTGYGLTVSLLWAIAILGKEVIQMGGEKIGGQRFMKDM
jgi:hypothetical protein